MEQADTSWITIPEYNLPVDLFWTQFWSVVNWFEPLVLPLIGLGIATVVIRLLLKNFFSSGG